MARTLSQPVTVTFDYTRSTGPVIGRFLTGLRDGVVLGGRTADGRVLTYDVNTNTNYNPDVEASAPVSGPREIARYLRSLA